MSEDQNQGSRRPATERADELLNRAGWVAGMVGSMVGMRLARIAAFAREEAEDLWAEAQSMRRRNGAATTPSEEPAQSAREESTRAGGRITVDATNAIRSQPEERVAEPQSINATDGARRRAEELGVDLRGIKGAGPGGRITVRDVNKQAGSSKP